MSEIDHVSKEIVQAAKQRGKEFDEHSENIELGYFGFKLEKEILPTAHKITITTLHQVLKRFYNMARYNNLSGAIAQVFALNRQYHYNDLARELGLMQVLQTIALGLVQHHKGFINLIKHLEYYKLAEIDDHARFTYGNGGPITPMEYLGAMLEHNNPRLGMCGAVSELLDAFGILEEFNQSIKGRELNG